MPVKLGTQDVTLKLGSQDVTAYLGAEQASGYVYESLRQGLVAYWPLNETATSGDVTAIDESGQGNDLTSNNSVLSTAGKIGNARDFVAANSEYLSIASNADMQFGDKDWTLSMWFHADDWGSYQIVAKDAASGREIECSLSTSAGFNRVRVIVYHSGGAVDRFVPATGTNLAAGEWYFLAIRHINSTGVITHRVNAFTNTAARPAGQTWNVTATDFTLGARAYSPFEQFFNGKIDECARWNRALSDTELDELYNSGNGINLGQRA
jgi:hypothetical protein